MPGTLYSDNELNFSLFSSASDSGGADAPGSYDNSTDPYYNSSSYGDSSYGYGSGKDSYGYGGDKDGYGYGEDAYGGYGEKKAYGDDFYYGAMSVAVLTLGLVIVVEAILHRIDLSAIGKPFHQAVLDAVYRELAVLGIVELGIHIMQQYYEYDKNKKAVFADVHFLLFYTDIFNALQAVIQAYATDVVTRRLWVRTEEVELDHYVEIREEYDRVHQLLYGDNKDTNGDTQQQQPQQQLDIISRIALNAKHRELLIQVRFHELRVCFLEAYNLPQTLKVSDYLMRSEQSVMISLAHVSPVAWLWLTAICNLLYYLGGIAAQVSGYAESSATLYSICFFIGMVVFILASLAVDRHMQNIFMKIMNSKHLWAFDDQGDYEQNEALAAEQRNLFFLGDPSLVITFIQFMQFGYAIALSIVFVYWGDMQKDEEFSPESYLLSSVFCYIVFVCVMARVIPRYTLCTNLGQLVDKKLLHETLAKHKVEKAEKFRQQKMERDEYYHTASAGGSYDDDDDGGVAGDGYGHLLKNTGDSDSDITPTGYSYDATTVNTFERTTTASISSAVSSTEEAGAVDSAKPKPRRRIKAKSEGVSFMCLVKDEEAEDAARGERRNSSSGIAAMDLATATSSSGRPRRSSVKAKSEGVALMRQLNESDSAMEASGRAGRGARRKSRSEGVSEMIDEDREYRILANLVKLDTKSVRNIVMQDPGSSSLGDGGQSRPRKTPGSLGDKIQQTRLANTTPIAEEPELSHGVPKRTDDFSTGLSAVDEAKHHEVEHHESVSFIERLRNFYTSSKFRFISHVLGTMICFFVVGMRVEGFLQKKCTVPEDDYSWDLPLHQSFLLECVWLVTGLTVSTSVLLAFVWKEDKNRRDWKAIIAATVNLVVGGTCLGLLLLAESKRCCEGDDMSGFQASENHDLPYDRRILKEECEDATLACTCSDFGYRVSGGLGSIEPWTALVAMQSLRFILARKIATWLQLGGPRITNDHGHGGHGHGHGPVVNTREIIGDAWQAAVAQHPDLVEKYGEFSGEVLQAMLGLHVLERYNGSDTTPMILPYIEDQDHGMALTPRHQYNERIALNDEQYKDLPPKVQQVIASGKVGMPLKICGGIPATINSARSLRFEVDLEQEARERLDPALTTEFPNTQLIRSVRRCDRMYLPLLNKWVTVDVVLTRREMIYMDVNTDGLIEDIKAHEARRQALIATRGGKGLRLSDVVTGRRIVGRLNLDDITAIHVDRELPSRKKTNHLDGADVEASRAENFFESWEGPGSSGDFDASPFAERWEQVQQDRLKIDTHHGTLYLRFYSDLVDAEKMGDKKVLQKNTAFQWTQTIARLCVDQLKQKLPNFGADTNAELLDYLQIVEC